MLSEGSLPENRPRPTDTQHKNVIGSYQKLQVRISNVD